MQRTSEIYKERQISWLIIIILLITMVYTSYTIYTSAIEIIYIVGFINFIPLFILLFFYQMTTTVYEDKIVIKYGIGVIKKTIHLKDIQSAKVVKMPFYVGAGIKYYKGGMLYSINFTKAVELQHKYKNSNIAIGSKNPQVLSELINKALQKENMQA